MAPTASPSFRWYAASGRDHTHEHVGVTERGSAVQSRGGNVLLLGSRLIHAGCIPVLLLDHSTGCDEVVLVFIDRGTADSIATVGVDEPGAFVRRGQRVVVTPE